MKMEWGPLGAIFAAIICVHIPLASGFTIKPFPANSVLGPKGVIAIPAAVLNLNAAETQATVSAVNNLGQMAITVDRDINEPDTYTDIYAYLPTPAYGRPAGLNFVDENRGGAESINDKGQIAGTVGDAAAVWNLDGSTYDWSAGTGVAAGLDGLARGTNNGGQVLFQNFQANGTWVYVYSQDNANRYSPGFTNLAGPLAWALYPPGVNSVAVNDLGDVLFNGFGGTYRPEQAYFHTGSPHDGLPASTTIAIQGDSWQIDSWQMYVALGMNQSDQVVGMAQFGYGENARDAPALWMPGSNAIDLNTLLPADSGWVLESVSGINDAGEIEGQGTFNGVPTTFLLTVPEPAAFPMIVASLLVIGRSMRQERQDAKSARNKSIPTE